MRTGPALVACGPVPRACRAYPGPGSSASGSGSRVVSGSTRASPLSCQRSRSLWGPRFFSKERVTRSRCGSICTCRARLFDSLHFGRRTRSSGSPRPTVIQRRNRPPRPPRSPTLAASAKLRECMELTLSAPTGYWAPSPRHYGSGSRTAGAAPSTAPEPAKTVTAGSLARPSSPSPCQAVCIREQVQTASTSAV